MNQVEKHLHWTHRKPATGFPAVAHAALTNPDAPEPLKRLRLTWAVARGRI